MKNRLSSIVAAAFLLLCALVLPASSAEPLKLDLVVPFPQGTTTSQAIEIFRAPFEKALGQTVDTVNVNTNQAVDGTRYVATEKRGNTNTLLITTLTPLVHAFVLGKPDYDVERDLKPVSFFGAYCFVLVTKRIDGISGVAGFVKWVKERPGNVKFAAGTFSARILGASLQQEAGVTFADMITAQNEGLVTQFLKGGNADATIMSLGPIKKYIEDGSLVALAVVGSKRCPALPSVPTFAESGLPGIPNAELWTAIYAPAGITKERQSQYAVAVSKTLNEPDVRTQIEALGFRVQASSPEWLEKYRQDQVLFWKDVMKKAGMPVIN